MNGILLSMSSGHDFLKINNQNSSGSWHVHVMFLGAFLMRIATVDFPFQNDDAILKRITVLCKMVPGMTRPLKRQV